MNDDDDGNKEEREKRGGEKKELMYSIDIYKQAMFFVKKGRSPTTLKNIKKNCSVCLSAHLLGLFLYFPKKVSYRLIIRRKYPINI